MGVGAHRLDSLHATMYGEALSGGSGKAGGMRNAATLDPDAGVLHERG